MLEVSVPCGSCGKPILGGRDFCEACGARVSDEHKEALRERLEASDFAYAAHRKRLRSARRTIGLLSILFAIGGVVYFFITQGQVDKVLSQLGSASDPEPLARPVAGATTVGELRSSLEREPWQILGLNWFLAVVMLVLWVWSKRAILPAAITALAIYIAVIVGTVLYDPSTIASGILMKIVVVAFLAKGVQSSLAARKLELSP